MMRTHGGGRLESIRRWIDEKPLGNSGMQVEDLVGADGNGINGRILGY